MKKKVIIDCDNTFGKLCWFIDDGLTILYVLGSPDLDIIGITTTFGNRKVEHAMKYTRKLLKAINREDIPLIKGAAKKGDYSTEAACFLAEKVASCPGEITLLALGPVGNLRGAAQIDPNFFRNLKEIILMGGIIKDRVTIGRTKIKDVNLRNDHEAAFRVLTAECPITVINCHICKQVPFTKEHLEHVNFWPKNLIRIIKNSLWLDNTIHKTDVLYIWDVLVPVVITHPELFNKNPVRILAAREEDVNEGRLRITSENEGVLIEMPSEILDPIKFIDIVIESWLRFHNSLEENNKGYSGLKNNIFAAIIFKFLLKIITPLALRMVFKKEGQYYIEK